MEGVNYSTRMTRIGSGSRPPARSDSASAALLFLLYPSPPLHSIASSSRCPPRAALLEARKGVKRLRRILRGLRGDVAEAAHAEAFPLARVAEPLPPHLPAPQSAPRV